MGALFPLNTGGIIVTVKAVIPCGGKILLLRKANGRWDLPGGKRESGESVFDCLHREVAEETGIDVDIIGIVDSQIRERPAKPDKLLITCHCRSLPREPLVQISDEHVDAACFQPQDIEDLFMLEEAKSSVRSVLMTAG